MARRAKLKAEPVVEIDVKAQAEAMRSAKAVPYNYPFTLLRVLDGDTIEARLDLGFKIRMDDFIRLFAVDTPEVKGKYAEARGKIAAQFTAAWFAAGKTFRCDSRKYNDREKYGRILGRIYRDKDPVSLNDALIKAGHIKLVKKPAARVYDPIMEAYTKTVRAARKTTRRKAA